MIDQQKLEKFHHMNQLLTDGGLVEKEMVRYHVAILVSDGLKMVCHLMQRQSF